MIRATLVVLLLLGLAITQVASQPSFSNSFSPSGSSSGAPTPSLTVSPSGSGSTSNAPSRSVSGSVTVSGTSSITASASVTVSSSSSLSISGSTSNTVTPPPAPVNVVNKCPGHIITVCPQWDNPANNTYASFVVTFVQSGCATCAPITFPTSKTSGKISNLLPATSYDVTVVGVTVSGLHSLPSAPVTFTTDPTDAKLDPSKDIHDITCVSVKDATTERYWIQCNWSAAAEPLRRLVIKWRCTSDIRKNDSNKKRIYGAKAQATSVTLKVNRDVATCAVFLRAYYARRPATRHALTVIMGL